MNNSYNSNLNTPPLTSPVAPVRKFSRTSTSAIMAAVFEPLRWVVPGYVPEGLCLLAGRQKLGKTWLAMDWAIAVASGGLAMGKIKCEQGDVLYIDLENGRRRIHDRIEVLFPDEADRPNLDRLEWVDDAPQLDQGFIACLDEWRVNATNPRLVVIDVFQRIKPAANGKGTAYESDYAIMSPLQQWATKHRIAIVAMMHTKKGGATDPLEAVSGSNGMSASADSTLLLDLKSGKRTLYVRGRDVEEKESALCFSGGRWLLEGEASEVRVSAERVEIIELFRAAAAPLSPAQLVSATGKTRANIDTTLGRMVEAGQVLKIARGSYTLPEKQAVDEMPDPVSQMGQISEVGQIGETGEISRMGDVNQIGRTGEVSQMSQTLDVSQRLDGSVEPYMRSE